MATILLDLSPRYSTRLQLACSRSLLVSPVAFLYLLVSPFLWTWIWVEFPLNLKGLEVLHLWIFALGSFPDRNHCQTPDIQTSSRLLSIRHEGSSVKKRGFMREFLLAVGHELISAVVSRQFRSSVQFGGQKFIEIWRNWRNYPLVVERALLRISSC